MRNQKLNFAFRISNFPFTFLFDLKPPKHIPCLVTFEPHNSRPERNFELRDATNLAFLIAFRISHFEFRNSPFPFQSNTRENRNG